MYDQDIYVSMHISDKVYTAEYDNGSDCKEFLGMAC